MADLSRIAQIRDLPLTGQPGGIVSVGEGYCFLPSGRRIMTTGATATISGTQPVGWLHAYGYEASNNTLGLELDSTAPSAAYRGTARTKTGDISRRYLGSGRIEAVGRLRAGRHVTVAAMGNQIILDSSTPTLTTPPRALNLAIVVLVAPTQQTIALANYVPLTASAVDLKISNMSNLTAYLGRPSMGTLSASNRFAEVPANTTMMVRCLLDGDLSVTLLASATGLLGAVVTIAAGNVVVEVAGYVFDR